jgi:hypothetical protein
MDNMLNIIDLTAPEIKAVVSKYRLDFIQEWDEEVERGMSLPLFVVAFYDYIIVWGEIPRQEVFFEHYYNRVDNCPPDKITALRARCYRAYPSLIRDIYFAKLAQESGKFDDVFYNTKVDTQYGVDIIVEKDGKRFGICLFINTDNSLNDKKIKSHRAKKDIADLNLIDILDVSIDPKRMNAGRFALYTTDTIENILKEMEGKLK